jgi:hypothetical protein
MFTGSAYDGIIHIGDGLNTQVEGDLRVIGTTSGSFVGDGSGLTNTPQTDISSLNTFTSSQEALNVTFATTGSNTFIGNQTINGDTEVSGSVDVNGTSTYNGNTTTNGNQTINGNIGLVGAPNTSIDMYSDGGNYDTFNIDLIQNNGTRLRDWNGGDYSTWLTIPTNTGSEPKPIFNRGLEIASGSDFIFENHIMFNYGAYSSNITQSGSAGVSQSIQLTQDEASGVSVVSGTQITLANAGTYSQTFSAQVLADAGADTIYVWWKKNGVNIPSSATQLKLANNEENVMTVNLVDTAAASDYYELVWQSTNGDAVLHTEAASGNIPAIPSVIYTITQIR